MCVAKKVWGNMRIDIFVIITFFLLISISYIAVKVNALSRTTSRLLVSSSAAAKTQNVQRKQLETTSCDSEVYRNMPILKVLERANFQELNNSKTIEIRCCALYPIEMVVWSRNLSLGNAGIPEKIPLKSNYSSVGAHGKIIFTLLVNVKIPKDEEKQVYGANCFSTRCAKLGHSERRFIIPGASGLFMLPLKINQTEHNRIDVNGLEVLEGVGETGLWQKSLLLVGFLVVLAAIIRILILARLMLHTVVYFEEQHPIIYLI